MSGHSRPSNLDKLLRPFDTSLELLFTRQCAVCDRMISGNNLCTECATMTPLQPPLCSVCGEMLPVEMQECGRCLNEKKRELDWVRAHFWYDERGRNFWVATKFRKRFSLLKEIVSELPLIASQLMPLAEGFVVVPIPMTYIRFQRRGMNLADWLGHAVAKECEFKIAANLILRSGNTMPQSLIRRKERLKNIRGTLNVAKRKRVPKKILIIDDVLTTGATIRECARVLRAAGAEQVAAWTLYRTPLRHSVESA